MTRRWLSGLVLAVMHGCTPSPADESAPPPSLIHLDLPPNVDVPVILMLPGFP